MADAPATDAIPGLDPTSNTPQVDWLLDYLYSLEVSGPFVRIIVAGVLIAISILLLLAVRVYIGYRLKRLENPDTGTSPLRIQNQELLSEEDVKNYSSTLLRLVRLLLSLVCCFGILTGAMMFSTFTENVAVIFLNIIFRALNYIWSAVIGYLPNLITIIIILLCVRFGLRIIRSVFDGISARRIRLPNFYPEWADTSFNLLKLLIYGLTVVVIFPYLPGSDSPAFQGVSIFVGLLLSLGSTTAVANMVAGVVLTYTRAFRVGDQVQISDTRGKIVERSLFVTRLQTLKNVVVSIPNSMVLNGHIINFSKNMGRHGQLVHSTVTIGYDVSWQKVNELLLNAAKNTPDLEAEPEAFVLQLSLDDFYVTYELNAWTRRSDQLPAIYSALHASILDAFHSEGVEILSPHYRANRDGNAPQGPAMQKA